MKALNTDKNGRIIIPKGLHAEIVTDNKKRAIVDNMNLLEGTAGMLTVGQKKGNSFYPTALYAPVRVDEKGRPVKVAPAAPKEPAKAQEAAAKTPEPAAKPSKAPKATKEPKAKAEKPQSRTGFIDELICKGGYTARQVAEEATKKHGGKFEDNLTIARSRPWHLKKAGKTPKLEAEAADGKVAFIRELYIEGKHTAAEVAALVVKKFDGDLAKTKVVVYSMPWHFKKQGIKGGWKKAEKPAAAK